MVEAAVPSVVGAALWAEAVPSAVAVVLWAEAVPSAVVAAVGLVREVAQPWVASQWA